MNKVITLTENEIINIVKSILNESFFGIGKRKKEKTNDKKFIFDRIMWGGSILYKENKKVGNMLTTICKKVKNEFQTNAIEKMLGEVYFYDTHVKIDKINEYFNGGANNYDYSEIIEDILESCEFLIYAFNVYYDDFKHEMQVINFNSNDSDIKNITSEIANSMGNIQYKAQELLNIGNPIRKILSIE